jgi:hypothetical protein
MDKACTTLQLMLMCNSKINVEGCIMYRSITPATFQKPNQLLQAQERGNQVHSTLLSHLAGAVLQAACHLAGLR